MRAFACLTIALFCLVVPAIARQDAPRSPRNANYVLSARLDPAARTIVGEGRLTWRNTTTVPASELRLHLYWNAWRDTDSTWMRGRQRAGDTTVRHRPATDRGAIELTGLRILTPAGPADVLDRIEFIAPDDGNTADRTLVSVPLDSPIPSAHDVQIAFTWTAAIPRTYDRTGVLGDDFFIAQWFPKVGVLQDDGWHAAQFHAHTEFFADFGTYDVSLTVPTGWIVGATGLEASKVDHDDGTSTHRYLATDVHDFAWATSPEFIEHRARFEAPDLTSVDLRLLLRPDHAGQADRHIAAAREALRHLGRRLGPFPWPNLTIVDPPTRVNPRAQGGPIGAMEYPTLIAAGTTWADRWADDLLEANIAHEVGHQYFQSVVATDETTDAWIDEGLATFLTAQILDEAFPGRFVVVDRYFGGLVTWRNRDIPWTRLHQGLALDAYRSTPGWDAPMTPAWRHIPRTSANTVYARTSLALESLNRLIGTDTMTSALATFYARGAFRHPTAEEFIAITSSVAWRDLDWFFDATLRRSGTFDYAVGEVTGVRASHSSDVESTVMVQRLAEGVFPVEVRVTFEDGSVVLERWHDEARTGWQVFTYNRPAPVTRVEVDPDRVLVLDANRTNNTWTSAPRADRAADKWTRRWMTWAQHLLLTYAFFA